MAQEVVITTATGNANTSAVNVVLGFVPTHVEIWNSISDCGLVAYALGTADAGYTFVGSTGVHTAIAADSVVALNSTSGAGFTIKQNLTNINDAAELLYIKASR